MSDTDTQDNSGFFVPRDTTKQDDNAEMTEEEFVKMMEGMSNEQVLEVVAEGMLNERGMTDLEDDVKQEMVKDLVERMTEFTNRAVLEQLTEDDLNKINDMTERGEATEEAVNEIIAAAGVDVTAVTTKALEKFREIYLADAEA